MGGCESGQKRLEEALETLQQEKLSLFRKNEEIRLEAVRAQEESRAKDELILKMKTELESFKRGLPRELTLRNLEAERNKRKIARSSATDLETLNFL